MLKAVLLAYQHMKSYIDSQHMFDVTRLIVRDNFRNKHFHYLEWSTFKRITSQSTSHGKLCCHPEWFIFGIKGSRNV
jgi:hypothetical protein